MKKIVINLLAVALIAVCAAFTFSSESAFALDPEVEVDGPIPAALICYSAYSNSGELSWSIVRCDDCRRIRVSEYDARSSCTP